MISLLFPLLAIKAISARVPIPPDQVEETNKLLHEIVLPKANEAIPQQIIARGFDPFPSVYNTTISGQYVNLGICNAFGFVSIHVLDLTGLSSLALSELFVTQADTDDDNEDNTYMTVRGRIEPLGLTTFLRGEIGVKCGKYLKPKIKIRHYLHVDDIERDGILVTDASINSLKVGFNEKLQATSIGGKIFQPLAQLIVQSAAKRLKLSLEDTANEKVREFLNLMILKKLPFEIQFPDQGTL